MPSTTRAQHRTMEGALHDEELRQKLGIPRKVAEEFVNADKRDHRWKEKERVKKAAEGQAMTPEMYQLLHR